VRRVGIEEKEFGIQESPAASTTRTAFAARHLGDDDIEHQRATTKTLAQHRSGIYQVIVLPILESEIRTQRP
jgi:hypothetical protein